MADRITNLSIEQYHADRRYFTNTALKHAAQWTRDGIIWRPRLMKSYIDGCAPVERTPALEFGQAFHSVAEGKSLEEVVLIIPQGITRAMNEYKKVWLPDMVTRVLASGKFNDPEAALAYVKRMEISWNDARDLRGCWDSLRDSPLVKEILAEEKVATEGTIRFDFGGLPFQVRPDLELANTIINWRTAEDPHAYLRNAYRLGYHRSTATERQGVYEVSRVWKRYLHIVIGKREPHDIRVYELPQCDIDLGLTETFQLVEAVRTWLYTEKWEADWETEITTDGIPHFHHQDSECSLIDEEFPDE